MTDPTQEQRGVSEPLWVGSKEWCRREEEKKHNEAVNKLRELPIGKPVEQGASMGPKFEPMNVERWTCEGRNSFMKCGEKKAINSRREYVLSSDFAIQSDLYSAALNEVHDLKSELKTVLEREAATTKRYDERLDKSESRRAFASLQAALADAELPADFMTDSDPAERLGHFVEQHEALRAEVSKLSTRIDEIQLAETRAVEELARVREENRWLLKRMGVALELIQSKHAKRHFNMFAEGIVKVLDTNKGGELPPTISNDHPESKCQLCGGANYRWHVDSPDWNAAMRSGDEPDVGSIVCPNCFMRQSQKMGIDQQWHIEAER